MTGMVGLVLLLALVAAALFALVYVAALLWRALTLGVTSLPRALKSLTVEPPPEGP
ncbi:hypothetical protein [Micromonospora sp. NPDC049107]|uniref:hypothetical protein n=1 Tax=Micromonospora sp. NPDC049107 TaxID=3154349 RepID=UPI0033E230EC